MLSGDHRYRMLVEELEEYAIFMVDQQGIVITWNKGAQRVLGYDEAEIVGRSSDVFFTSEDLAGDIPQAVLKAAAKEGRASDNRWHIRKNGSRVYISGVTLAMRDEHSVLNGFAKVMRDITLRKQTERRLAAQYAVTQILASADSLEDATIQVLEAICLTLDWDWAALWRAPTGDADLHCIDVYHRDPTLTLPFETISRSTRLACGRGLPGRVWASGKTEWIPDVAADDNFPRRQIAQQCGLHGAVCFPVQVDAANVGAVEFISQEAIHPDADLIRVMGNIGNQLGQFIERKRIEQERAEALAREQSARAEAEAASNAKDQFLAVLSHELRTPLTPILALASILSRDKTLPGELQDDIEMIRRNVEQIGRAHV